MKLRSSKTILFTSAAGMTGLLCLGATLLGPSADHAHARAAGDSVLQRTQSPRSPQQQPPRNAMPAAAQSALVGVLLPEQAADVVAPAAGLVESMHAALGEIVDAGQLLVRLSVEQAALEHQRSLAEREAARAALGRARLEQSHALQEATRSESLSREGLLTHEQLAQARFKLSESRALAAEAESRLAERGARTEQLAALRDQTRVTANFRGRVAVRYVSAGTRVAAGTPLLRLISDGAVVLRFAIPEQMTELQQGAAVDLVPVEHPHLAFVARVVRVAPEIDAASRMRTVEAAPLDSKQLTEAGLIGAIVHVRPRAGDRS